MELENIILIIIMILISIALFTWLFYMALEEQRNQKASREKLKGTFQGQWSTDRNVLYEQLIKYFENASQSERFALYLKYYSTIHFEQVMFNDRTFFYKAKNNNLICEIITQHEIKDKYGFIIQKGIGHYELSQEGKDYVKSYPFVCSNLPDY